MFITDQVPAEKLTDQYMIIVPPGLVAYPEAVIANDTLVSVITRHGKTLRFSPGELVTRIIASPPSGSQADATS